MDASKSRREKTMTIDLLQAVQEYVEANIGEFHQRRLEKIKKLQLDDVLRRKNPYLFRAKSQTVIPLVTGIMDAFLSSQEEGLFGNFMEGVAVFVAQQVFDGYKPSTEELVGIDLVFAKRETVYIVDVKSGPNWGNSSQVTKMYLNFRECISRLQPEYPGKQIIPVNGCTYGKERKRLKEGKIKEAGSIVDVLEYWKLCGQDFWYFISDNSELYVEIIEPLGHQAKERNIAFQEEYDSFLNRLVRDFLNKYCHEDGSVAWDQLTKFVSKSDNIGIVTSMDVD